jgi:prefoldin subunit 5
MRKTSDPNVVCPDDLYTKAELARMEEIADIEEQINAINRELQRLDDAHNGADMAGDYAQLSAIETRMEVLIELQCELQGEIKSLETVD